VTLNPPDEDHWILRVEEYLAELGLADILVHRFVIPPGEKSRHFAELAQQARTQAEQMGWAEAAEEFEAYRRRNKAFLEAIDRPDLVARLSEGQVGGLKLGESVVPEFSRRLHVYLDEKGQVAPIPVYPGVPIIRGWDAGLTPTTVWLQVLPNQNVNVLGCRLSLNKGMTQHLLDEVVPFQRQYNLLPPKPGDGFRAAKGGYVFRDIGDPACGKGSNQANSEETVARVIENMLGASFEPGPQDWSSRREALHWAFTRKGVGDRQAIQIDGTDPGNRDLLIKGLGGRFHYRVDPSTGRVDPSIEVAKRVSGIYHNPVDALAYPLAVLFPAHDIIRRQTSQPAPRTRRPASWIGA